MIKDRRQNLALGLFAIVFLIGSAGTLFYFGVLNASRGPSSGDDAWIALSAENVVTGYGYATSVSSSRVIPFDQNISTGPVAVLTTAALIHCFGPKVWVPGASQLLLLLSELCALTIILARRYGFNAAAIAVALLITLLLVVSTRNWYFGALLGEPLALGFLLIGFLLLAGSKSLLETAVAGIVMSLAFLSKEIALFPIIGATMSSAVLDVVDSRRRRQFVSRYATLFVTLLLLPTLFELARLFELGITQYLAGWSEVATRATPGIGSAASLRDRWNELAKIVFQDYSSPVLAFCAACLLVLSLSNKAMKDSEVRSFSSRYVCIGLGSGAVLIAYLLFFSSLWSRYLWIGAGILLSVPCVITIRNTGWRRFLVISLGFTTLVLFRCGNSMASMEGLLRDKMVPLEREEVASLVSGRAAGLPLAAESWASIDDILYLLGSDRGRWATGQSVEKFRGHHFLAIISKNFTNMESEFATHVVRKCNNLTPKHQRIQLFECDASYWGG